MRPRISIGLLVCFLSMACLTGVAVQEGITPVPSPPPTPTSRMEPIGTAIPSSQFTWTTYTNSNDVNDMALDQKREPCQGKLAT